MEISMKKRLQAGEKLIGTWSEGSSPTNIEVMGLAGFDFVIIDNEHNCHSNPDMLHLLRAAEVRHIAPIIRVPGADYEDHIKKALDAGASGIMVPNVRTKEDAEKVVRFSKYAPLGRRGCCAYLRHNYYGLRHGTVDVYSKSNDEVLSILLIENTEAVKNIDEIFSVEGIDAAFIGPLDMAVDMGVTGRMDDPELEKVCAYVASKAHEHSLPVGMFCDSDQMVLKWIGQLDYITNGTDVNQLLTYASQQLATFRKAAKSAQ